MLQQTMDDAQQSNGYQQRTEIHPCFASGEKEINYDQVDGQLPDTQLYIFKNCQYEPGMPVLNGTLKLIIQEKTIVDENTTLGKSRVEFDNLEMGLSNKRFLYTGSQTDETTTKNTIITSRHRTANIFERDMVTEKNNFLADFELLYHQSAIDQIKGRLYKHDIGYITLSGSNDLELYNPTQLLTRVGSLILTGASHSQAKVEYLGLDRNGDFEHYLDIVRYLVHLDQDGDGTFELRSIQSGRAIQQGDAMEFVSEYQPVAKINWNNYGDGPTPGQEINLYGDASYDPDSGSFTALNYLWTLEAKPENSQAMLKRLIGHESSFIPDVRGHYQVSLKVTDSDGNTALAVENFDLSDKPPLVEFSAYEIENGELELGKDISLSLYVRDIEDSWQQVDGYDFTWDLQRPQNSQAILQDAGRSSAHFKADQLGDYQISYTTSDSQGNSTTAILDFTVINSPPTAQIDGRFNIANGGIVVNKTINLHTASDDPGTSTYNLQHDWELVSKPVGSQSTLGNSHSPYNVEFTPDLIGQYRVRLTVTDPYGASDSIEKDYNVVAP